MSGNRDASSRENLVFMVFTSFWVLGKGIQLAANSIGHLTGNMTGSDIYNLTYFYDEVLGHYLWHLGVIGLSALLIYRQWKSPFPEGEKPDLEEHPGRNNLRIYFLRNGS